MLLSDKDINLLIRFSLQLEREMRWVWPTKSIASVMAKANGGSGMVVRVQVRYLLLIREQIHQTNTQWMKA